VGTTAVTDARSGSSGALEQADAARHATTANVDVSLFIRTGLISCFVPRAVPAERTFRARRSRHPRGICDLPRLAHSEPYAYGHRGGDHDRQGVFLLRT
jgi:hypothetical protein